VAPDTVTDVDEPTLTPTADAPRPSLITPVVIIVVALVLDQLTKWWALEALEDGDVIELLPTLEFDLAFNSGFSFGTGEGLGRWISVLVIALCLFLVQQIRVSQTALRANLAAVVLGGALGNLVDRIFRADDGILSGEVVDFIDVTWYAVFNVADIFVVCGCIAFGLHEVRLARQEARAAQALLSDEPEGEPAT
jgi:signal peptidase II